MVRIVLAAGDVVVSDVESVSKDLLPVDNMGSKAKHNQESERPKTKIEPKLGFKGIMQPRRTDCEMQTSRKLYDTSWKHFH